LACHSEEQRSCDVGISRSHCATLSGTKNNISRGLVSHRFFTSLRSVQNDIQEVPFTNRTPTSRAKHAPRSDSLSVLMCATIFIGMSFRGATQLRRGNLISRPVILSVAKNLRAIISSVLSRVETPTSCYRTPRSDSSLS